MGKPSYAALFPSLKGEPWEDWMDAALLDDRAHGCTLLTMAMRARRSMDEVRDRLAELDAILQKQQSVTLKKSKSVN